MTTTLASPTQRKSNRFGVQTKLVMLILLVTIPLLVGVTVYLSTQAGNQIEAQALSQLQQSNQSITKTVTTWLEYNRRILQEIATQPGIIGLAPRQQEPILSAFSSVHPGLYLAHTIGLDGLNIARSDGDSLLSYQDRLYFKAASDGTPFTYELLIGRTSGRPALVMASPVYDNSGKINSVITIARELDEISEEVVKEDFEEQIAFLVDENNLVVAHPNPDYTTQGNLYDLSNYPPVAALQRGERGIIAFTDATGREWVAYINRLENGWGVVTQRPEDILLAPVRQFQSTSFILITLGALTMLALAWFTVRQALRPIAVLTETASAIAAGDLNKQAIINSKDEFGLLANTFNEMTARLRESITSLEERVAERTKAMTTSAEISTAASTILDIDILLRQVVNLAKERFGLYHAHIYLLDEFGENLVLASGAGEAGIQMVAQGRSIPLSQEKSLVARAAREREGVTVNDVTQEPDFLPNPLLPDTRSELAVPMMVGEKVIGVFDVQSDTVERFTEADIAVQITLAAQIASAIQNARSYTEISQNQELLSGALKIARLGNWEYNLEKDLFTFNDQFYSIFRTTVADVGGYRLSSAEYASKFVYPDDAPLVGSEIQKTLESKERYYQVSIEHRSIFPDGEIGYIAVNINVERDENGKILRWYGANQDITERRQVEELNKQRARQQESINAITQKIQSTTSVEQALQITARELGQALGKKPTLVSLGAPTKTPEKNESTP